MRPLAPSLARRSPADDAPRTDPSPDVTDTTGRWVLFVTVLGSSLPIIDVTAMNVVAPAIQADLDTTVAGVQWVLSGYTLFFASLMLVGGALGDRYGRGRLFAIGSIVFAAGSLASALAPDAPILIAARCLQGTGAALLVPGSLSLIGGTFEGEARGKAIGVWSGFSALMAVIGPVLGGVLSDIGTWRLVFLINIPIALGLLIPLWRKVPESKDPDAGPIDYKGAALATLGLGLLTYGIIQSGIDGWRDPKSLTGLVTGPLVLTLFVWRERHARRPMVPLPLFRHRGFTVANLLTLFVYYALAAGMFFLPMRLIFLDGYSPTLAGLAVMPVALLIGLLSPRMGAWGARHGNRTLLILGPLVAGLGYALLARPGLPDATFGPGPTWLGYVVEQFPGVLGVGIGMSMVAAPVSDTVLGSVPRRHVGLASGVNNAVSRLAAVLAVASSGVIALALFAHWLAVDLDAPDGLRDRLAPETADEVWDRRTDLAAADPPESLSERDARAVEAAYDRAFLAGYRGVQLTMAASAALGGLLAFLLPRGQTKRALEPDAAPA